MAGVVKPGQVAPSGLAPGHDAEAAAMRPKAQPAPKLVALDAPRWIASVMIVLSHFYGGSGVDPEKWHPRLGAFAWWGGMWSSFFFILSGFVLSYVEMARPAGSSEGQLSTWEYAKKRLIAVYPTYALSIFLSIFQKRASLGAWAMLPLNVLMLQSWLPLCYPSEGGVWLGIRGGFECSCTKWTATGWFMSALLFYWLLVRPMARVMRRASLRTSLLVLAATWAWSIALGVCAGSLRGQELNWQENRLEPWLTSVVQFGPAGYIHVFLAGVATARLFIILAVRDAETGGAVSETTQCLALFTGEAAGEDGAQPSRGSLALTALLRCSCCLGYAMYGALVLGYALLKRPGNVLDSLQFYWAMHNGGLIPVFVLILLGAGYGADPLARRLFTSKWLVALSKTSYTQYLIQMNVNDACELHFGYWALAVLPVALPLTCFLVERYYGSVMTQWLRSA